MGFVFQACDTVISSALGVERMPYGDMLMQPADEVQVAQSGPVGTAKFGCKVMLTPVVAGAIESVVSNRAETQRFWGLEKSAKIESRLAWNPFGRICGPAFVANSSRNAIMSTTTFVMTPTLFLKYFPQDQKNTMTLFWFGLGVNIFAGNVVAITQQSLWGRVLDYMAEGGGRNANYRAIVGESFKKEGFAAFFTFPKWFARVMMNAPIQGTVPWFYNEILPIGEPAFMRWAAATYRTCAPPEQR